MYRYSNNGKIMGMKMVDFQLSMCDYGMKDLIFFLVSSGKKEIIDNNLNELITLYYETFIDTLKSLKVDTKDYPREEFDRLLRECAPLKFPQCIMMIQVIKATRGSAPDVNSIKNEQAFLSIGKGQLYDEKLLHVLHTFVKNGWLADWEHELISRADRSFVERATEVSQIRMLLSPVANSTVFF